jgi:hypothetical protein
MRNIRKASLPKPDRLPMTMEEHLNTVEASCLRCMEVEDKLVARTWVDPIQGLPEAIAVAAAALKRMDSAFDALPEGACPWVWPISVAERELVTELWHEHLPDATTVRQVGDLLDEFAEEATADEVAQGALRALRWAAIRAEQAAQ